MFGVVFMLGVKQRIIMLEKLSFILVEMKSCKRICEISEKTGIPTSTIQRYLQRDDLLLCLFDYDMKVCSAFRLQIDIWLQNAKVAGNQLGGVVTQEKHGYQKEKSGKFSGIGRK